MQKIIYNLAGLFFLLLATGSIRAQVGVNTTNPAATLDVIGNTDKSKALDGIIAPRVKGSELASYTYTALQKGALVYVTEAAPVLSGQAVHIKSPNTYYYFDGSAWEPLYGSLYDVVERGNFAPRYISFTGSSITKQGTTDAALGMNPQTYSMYFGNMNQMHTGTYNLSYGYGALQKLSTASGNVAFGSYSLNGVTTGAYNTFIGHISGYDLSNAGKIITGNVNVGLGNATLAKLTSGYKNIAIGQSALNSLNTGSYNTIIGQSSGQFITTESKNVMLGAQAGGYIRGENNVFIGTGAGHSNTVNTVETVNNRLVIHSNASLVPSEAIGTENAVDLSASWTNGLIIGDFAERWLKINGTLNLNPTYHMIPQSDASHTLKVVARPDGKLGLINDNVTAFISILETATPSQKIQIKQILGI
ncbi:hypothetical protein [Chryseobacterium sp.]|uniref:hypothetical protein n=1 Tax=Chryseobacterium sp. TaxID=1871047 RepID=UPI00289FB00E|nr:hypothetical protein [Chryseobacterium sp.]